MESKRFQHEEIIKKVKEYVIAVDVGTRSVRVGVFDTQGQMKGYSEKQISIFFTGDNFVEQSSENIWSATSWSVQSALKRAGVSGREIVGLAFDATCSLVALDRHDEPLSVSPTGRPERNVIVWMDHRAIDQAEKINATHHGILKYLGGRISPEQEPPKLLWLKEKLPASWAKAGKFMDLVDFMTYRATGADVRSLCTTVCKWTYLGHEGRWDKTFFDRIGIPDVFLDNKIGVTIKAPGESVGNLLPTVATELGLTKDVRVAVGIVDAHAGGIGVLGTEFNEIPQVEELNRVVALIGGTSSCHMAVSAEPRFIPGIWGPYFGAMIPGMWLNEGGQSATGSLLDHIINISGVSREIEHEAKVHSANQYDFLNETLMSIKARKGAGPEISKEINILPYFLGNRSPRADPSLRGIISGLTLSETMEAAALLYYSTIQAIAYGTRHIIQHLNAHGYRLNKILACGGGIKNPIWLQEHADITGCEIVVPRESEAVLLGTAMLAAVAAGRYDSIIDAAVKMSYAGSRYYPNLTHRKYHDAKYAVFLKMYDDFLSYRRMMSDF